MSSRFELGANVAFSAADTPRNANAANALRWSRVVNFRQPVRVGSFKTMAISRFRVVAHNQEFLR